MSRIIRPLNEFSGPGVPDNLQAHYQDYPFGRGRCVRRIWIEKNKKGERFCFQTSHKSFNLGYGSTKEEFEQVTAWNKPKKSTYGSLSLILLDEDSTETISGEKTEHIGLPSYPWKEKVVEFKSKYGDMLSQDLLVKLAFLEGRG